MNFKAILFDNDGILMDTEKLYFYACRDALAEEGFEYTEEMYAHYTLYNNIGARGYLIKEKGYAPEQADVVNKRWLEIYLKRAHGNSELFPETTSVLQALHKKFKLGLVTGSKHEEMNVKLAQTGIRDFFECYLAREDYEHSKPSPDPYLLAAEKLNLNPCECLVIEDSPRGVQSAKSADMTCFVIPNGLSKNLEFPEADCTLKNLEELLEILL